MTDILSRFNGVKKSGRGWCCRCPAHNDSENSLSVTHADGKWLLKCFAGCTVEAITSALGLSLSDLFDEKGAPKSNPSGNQTTERRSRENNGVGDRFPGFAQTTSV